MSVSPFAKRLPLGEVRTRRKPTPRGKPVFSTDSSLRLDFSSPKETVCPVEASGVHLSLVGNKGQMTTPTIHIRTEVVEPNRVIIHIADNGPGIPSEILDKIFDPFFTTKPVGKGTGLGLSICYQIIEKHQGQISVNSLIGQGTEFVITLPIKREQHL